MVEILTDKRIRCRAEDVDGVWIDIEACRKKLCSSRRGCRPWNKYSLLQLKASQSGRP